MTKFYQRTQVFLAFAALASVQVRAHGYLYQPASRNYIAFKAKNHYEPMSLNSDPRGGDLGGCGASYARGGGAMSAGVVKGDYTGGRQTYTVDNVYQGNEATTVKVKMTAYHAGFFTLYLYTNPRAYDGADIRLDVDNGRNVLKKQMVQCTGDGQAPAGTTISPKCCFYQRDGTVHNAGSAMYTTCPGGLTYNQFSAGNYNLADFYSMWWLPGKTNSAPNLSGKREVSDPAGLFEFPIKMPNAECTGVDRDGKPRCVLQWWWLSNNSCDGWQIPGTSHKVTNPTIEGGTGKTCSVTVDNGDGVWGEQFYNCADIRINRVADGPTPPPTPIATTPAPVPTPAPANPCAACVHNAETCHNTGSNPDTWIMNGTKGCRAHDGNKGACVPSQYWNTCKCIATAEFTHDRKDNGACNKRTTNDPIPAPTPPPTTPAPVPTTTTTTPAPVPTTTTTTPAPVPTTTPAPVPTTTPAPASCVANESVDGQETYNCPIPKTPSVLYAGGNGWDSEFRFGHQRDAHVDILMLAFITEWSQTCAEAPAALGSIGVPKLHTNACVVGTTKPSKCGQHHEGQCIGGGIEDQILKAQKAGQRIILSVGGASSRGDNGVANMNEQKGRELAKALWEMFLGGHDPAWTQMRPFGPKVVFDGIDLDLEDQPKDCDMSYNSIGSNCQKAMRGWGEFSKEMRRLMDADTRKRYLITAVPINSMHTKVWSNYGSHIQGYMDAKKCDSVWLSDDRAAIDAKLNTMTDGYLKQKIDFIWPQFYPSPQDITMLNPCWENDLMSWAYVCEKFGGAKCRVGVGLPMGPGAAASGVIGVQEYINKLKAGVQRRPLLQKHFGGTMGWDEMWDWKNFGAKGQKMFSEEVKELMKSEIVPLLRDSNPTPTPAPASKFHCFSGYAITSGKLLAHVADQGQSFESCRTKCVDTDGCEAFRFAAAETGGCAIFSATTNSDGDVFHPVAARGEVAGVKACVRKNMCGAAN